MASAVYYVLLRSGEWKIQLNGKHFGPCPTQEHAIEVALSAARKAAARGYASRVVVQDGSVYRTAWTAWSEPAPLLRAASF